MLEEIARRPLAFRKPTMESTEAIHDNAPGPSLQVVVLRFALQFYRLTLCK